jgi:hypothetical protein
MTSLRLHCRLAVAADTRSRAVERCEDPLKMG